MKKPRKPLPYVNSFRDRHGSWRHYYRRGSFRQRIDGEIGTAEWIDSYQKINKTFERAPAGGPPPGSFAEAVAAYLASPKFAKLKPKTQGNYRAELDRLSEHLGKAKLKGITRGVVAKIRDQIAATSPRRAIEVLKVLNLVFGRAQDLDMIDRNPAKGVENPVGYKAEPWRPWDPEDIEAFLARAEPVWRRAFMVLLYTGLRRDDAINLRREHIVNGGSI